MAASGWDKGVRLCLSALRLLVAREHTTSELMEVLGVSRDVVDHVLSTLRATGVAVSTRREGRFAYHGVTRTDARVLVGL